MDFRMYIGKLQKTPLSKIECPHCAFDTLSSNGKEELCNFCEQYLNLPDYQVETEKGAEASFKQVHELIDQGKWGEVGKKVDEIAKANQTPRVLYLSGVFYKYLSDAEFFNRNYELQGFMEDNAKNIRASLDATSKSKEYFFKAVKMVGDELKQHVQVDQMLIFLKFMSEIKLERIVDAGKTLKTIQQQTMLSNYATMVYAVEANTKDVALSLERFLSSGEPNSFYYLAKYLAKEKKVDDAYELLNKLNQKVRIFMAYELMTKVKLTQEASRM